MYLLTYSTPAQQRRRSLSRNKTASLRPFSSLSTSSSDGDSSGDFREASVNPLRRLVAMKPRSLLYKNKLKVCFSPLQTQSSVSSHATEMEEAEKILFEIGDYLLLDAELEEQQAMQRTHFQQNSVDASGSTTGVDGRDESLPEKRSTRVAFITQSENENLDDGYKWRKYGKKMVKGNPNPRNYYRCSIEGCSVKKRVERMKEDSSCVMTTYEGRHNHMTPSELAHHGAAHFLPLN